MKWVLDGERIDKFDENLLIDWLIPMDAVDENLFANLAVGHFFAAAVA